MQLPPDLQVGTFSDVTNAAGNLSRNVVAVPGVGFRLRIWAWGAVLEHTETGPTGVQAVLRGSVSLAPLGWGAFRATGPRETWKELPGGLVLPENEAAQVAINVTPAAATDVHMQVYYTAESI